MPQYKGRKIWTPEEDQLLKYAIEKEDPHNPNPSKWTAISKHVPNRSNRDCRKRWTSNMAFTFIKGSWSPTEDAMLALGMERYGERWSLVSMVVKSRNSDQCAKRWREILDPNINRARWSPAEDNKLIQAVEQHGTAWAKIGKKSFRP
ncbi:hypothetical protein BT96DRAFT_817011 [Gymnopus androsaceus JB14]|uniref:Homeodomain-like protein n=1 Tax=Gymnopus androsaceus JB14 TaxID=1447944 RepID=A0A6A4HUD3_9AGAR|nr:hypothetical protein BT96DRAFT_817011 [Gymnopus androsaceus JB14]